jgi:hypothetical protein
MNKMWAATVLLALAGCAATPEGFSEQQQQQISSVDFMRPYELSRTDISVTSLGEVQGESCQSNFWDDEPSQEQALLELKLAAAAVGANRIILKGCERAASEQCTSRWLCAGDAHQVQPLQ